ncbi:DivIVA domain-containing protein [Actinoplanes utahensis]|uniref:Diviva domain-containing protein n=1 Tax=Actinoplanes utahensis TaxID=1869 RepID=A0A0A6UCF6_ACTUT|nr:DivIVA domain-containing protein [Actinoplanes utahensis]KHD73166.1 diviva domain-containing protein [Actinoplanes utahensis]GIF34823.1 hypothetical protein Aut01nite_78090 [Actinoplanes utahensis]
MTSQGQRFRRRALRRGYKVDEVDAFLDRVEATLAGEQVGPPVGAQEVHDVVFRVRFGGYDEWQVDLHLDRVERQLAEFEERGGRPATDPMRDSMRSGLTTGSISGPPAMGPGPGGPGPGGPGGFDRGGFDRGPGGQPPQPQGYPGQPQGFPGQGQGGFPGQQPMQPQGFPGQPMQPPGAPQMNPAARTASPPTERITMPPQMPQRQPQQQLPPASDQYGRYDEPTGYGQQQPPQRPGPPPGYDPPGYDQGGYDQGGFDGFEPGRHGKTDMTAEIRMPDRDPRGGYGQMPGAPMQGSPMAMPGSPMPGAPMSGPPYGGGGYGGPQQPQLGPPLGEPGGELYRVDQLRRTFQPRRFGSGYDPSQVDRLFEGILQAMTGRGPMPVNENDLDMLQFGLVPNGYFEAEVDAALREVKDILLRRR